MKARCAGKRFPLAIACLAAVLVLLSGKPGRAEAQLSTGQLVYVPVYSHIYYGDSKRKFDLAATLSIRNTDPAQPIMIKSVDYHSENGKLLKSYVKETFLLAPLESKNFIIMESDTSGGASTSFLVTWKSENAATQPLLEGVMIGAKLQQGVSFTSRGIVLKELAP